MSISQLIKRQLTLSTHHIYTLPIVILMPHSRCNCRCVMCDIWKANVNGQEITVEQLQPHLDHFRQLNVQWVTLSGGEALMHSNLWKLCEQLKGLGVKVTLLSTGLLLKKYAVEIVRWCDEVIVSLDGSQVVHDQIRNVPRAFERLVEGIGALREVRGDYWVSGRCVLQRHNFHDLPNIVRAAKEIGLQQISFLAADVSSTAFNRSKPWGDERISDIALSPNEVGEFEQIIEQLIEQDRNSGFIAESPAKLRRLPRYYAALNGNGEFPAVRCNAPWVSTVIEADGTVRPCFFHAAIGNIHQSPLPAILNSPTATHFRQQLDMDSDPICRKCVCSLKLGVMA